MMTRRERLRRCYYHEELDRPAVYCRTGFPDNDPSYDPLRRLLTEKTELKGQWSAGSLLEPPPITVHDESYSEEFVRQVMHLATPRGQLTASQLIGLKQQPGMAENHFISDHADAETYLSLPEPAISGDVQPFFQADRQIGEAGIVHVLLGMNAVARVVVLIGSETFAMMTVTDRDILHALCQRESRILLKLTEYVLAGGLGPFFSTLGQEYVVPPLHGPKDFADFCVRYDKPIFDRIHDAGGRIHVHCHGPIRTIVPGFLDMGVDVLHPFEAPPMGDVEPRQIKEMVRGRICLEGNIQIGDMYEHSPDDIREQTTRLIEETFDDHRGLIVCPSASPWIAGGGPRCFQQFQAMIDTVTQYR